MVNNSIEIFSSLLKFIFSESFDNGTDSYQSRLLTSVLNAAGFSPEEIELKRRSSKFFIHLDEQLCSALAYDTIYVGSITEGINGGLYYSGEESDIDAILPFFEEIYVNDGQLCLDKGLPKPEVCPDKWRYMVFQSSLIFERPSFFAFHDEDFPGYMKIYCTPDIPFSFDKIPSTMKDGYLENKSFHNLVRKTDAKDLNITTETTNQYESNGPAVTEKCFTRSNFFGTKQESLTSDNVPCLEFDGWPSCATFWISRHKPNGWPTDEIIKQVVFKKCLLAPVGHRDSRDKDFQWRLSMRGENILFAHLNEVQLHCYILLKIILKDDIRPLLSTDNKDILSSYCMKNLIFWCAEGETVDWKVSNLVCCLKVCIRKLVFYLQENCLPHYIVEGRNLFSSKLKPDISKIVQNALLRSNENIMAVLNLRSFQMVRSETDNFRPELLNSLTERSIILQCWHDKMRLLFHYFTTFEFFWLNYDRHASLESIYIYEDELSEIETYEGVTVFQNDYSVMINSIIGLLSYSFYRRNCDDEHMIDKAKKHLFETFKSSRPCIRLRLATFFLIEEKFELVINMCSDIMQKKRKLIPPKQIWNQVNGSGCKLDVVLRSKKLNQLRQLKEAILAESYSQQVPNILTQEDKDIVEEFKNGMFVDPYFKVTYMTAELWAVPDVIQLELLSVPERLKKFNEDKFHCPKYDQVPCIRIHPLLNCYLLIYLSYDALRKKTERNDILAKINHLSADDIAVENNQVLFYNILVYCNSKAGYNKRAAKYLVRSFIIFPSRHNAAFGYLKDIVQQSLTLIRTWKGNAM
ncbi:unnamed protein product [Mytilus edulis]|uniref:Mab-21-like HhH/H2TH-like domain-containing protein n=1 Tax=Mytilus edulis TaxID=6550 RepID=A0A8S3STG1_MYTED|nr:unnamed protein product [Mytilus edulis]